MFANWQPWWDGIIWLGMGGIFALVVYVMLRMEERK